MKPRFTPREVLISKFKEIVTEFPKSQFKSVLVLGGAENEPELAVLRSRFDFQCTFSDCETREDQENLNIDLNFKHSTAIEKFDLILCSQVLEHVWNFDNAATNIMKLLKPDGIAWISVPASNFPHGSPDYYISGFSQLYLIKLFRSKGFNVLASGTISNKRVLLYRHLLNIWPSSFQLRFPFFALYGCEGTLFRKMFYNLTTFPFRMAIVCSSAQYLEGDTHPIESWIALQKSR